MEVNMRKKMIYVLDKDDKKTAQLLTKLGMPRHLAKTLMYLSHVDECYSADIEQGADLRQPEVSLAMRELRRKKWVKKRDLKKNGKGRPLHIYKPAAPLSEIVKKFEQEKLSEIESIEKELSELKQLITKK